MIDIVPRTAVHDADLAALILAIQRDEFGFELTLDDQPDLLDIPGFYRHGDGNFWVALDDGRVVGTIALKDLGEHRGVRCGALRKMFVAATHRGPALAVAATLLDTLLGWCANHGIAEVDLGTTDRFVAAHRFYEKHGFTRIDPEALPADFPRMPVDTRFYRRVVATG